MAYTSRPTNGTAVPVMAIHGTHYDSGCTDAAEVLLYKVDGGGHGYGLLGGASHTSARIMEFFDAH